MFHVNQSQEKVNQIRSTPHVRVAKVKIPIAKIFVMKNELIKILVFDLMLIRKKMFFVYANLLFIDDRLNGFL